MTLPRKASLYFFKLRIIKSRMSLYMYMKPSAAAEAKKASDPD